MNKHQPHDLKQMQSLPLEAKIIMTQQRIRQWYDHWDGMVYVSFSGGKDSTVLKHIVDNTPGVHDVPALFVNTGLEYPEIQKFAKDVKAGRWDCFNSNVEIVRPEMRFDDVLKHHGYPVVSKVVSKRVEEARSAIKNGRHDAVCVQQIQGRYMCGDKPSIYNYKKWEFLLDSDFRVSHKCCNEMKKKPLKQYAKQTGRVPFIGTLASESTLRLTRWLKSGCNAFEQTNPTSQPLSFWTEQDVLHYIKKFDVPYCPVYGEIQVKPYDETVSDGQINMIDYLGCYEPEDTLETTGCDRTGCIFCMFGCHLEKTPNRFQRLKETHPNQYRYCIGGGEMVDGKWQPSKEGLGLGHVLDYIGAKYD